MAMASGVGTGACDGAGRHGAGGQSGRGGRRVGSCDSGGGGDGDCCVGCDDAWDPHHSSSPVV